jgi:8-oxo-dGTP pyrophosphatase MutT (NUDIX family)
VSGGALALAPAVPSAPTDWRARIMRALAAADATGEPDVSDSARSAPPSRVVPAAVLVPIVLRPEPAILLTRRTDALSTHAGQVSFPGGRLEPHDRDEAGAALRETEEETGLAAGAVELVGRLPRFLTGTGFSITPVVGLLRPPFTLAPEPREVAEIFELPLAVVLDEAAARREQAEFRGQMRRFWVIPHDRHYIWGATAAILVNLGRMLRKAG